MSMGTTNTGGEGQEGGQQCCSQALPLYIALMKLAANKPRLCTFGPSGIETFPPPSRSCPPHPPQGGAIHVNTTVFISQARGKKTSLPAYGMKRCQSYHVYQIPTA